MSTSLLDIECCSYIFKKVKVLHALQLVRLEISPIYDERRVKETGEHVTS